MRLFRPRFTVRGMMLAVALVAINLTAVSATLRASPARFPLPVAMGNGRGVWVVNPDGSEFYAQGNLERGHGTPRMIRPPRPTRTRTLAPAVAGLSTSVLLLGLASGRPRSRLLRVAAMAVLVPLAAVSLHAWWVLYGGGVPVHRLKLDQTEDEVRRIVRSPLIEGTTRSTSWMRPGSTRIVAPTGSLRYLVLDFDEHRRLRQFTPASHERGGHPAARLWHHDRSAWDFWRNAQE